MAARGPPRRIPTAGKLLHNACGRHVMAVVTQTTSRPPRLPGIPSQNEPTRSYGVASCPPLNRQRGRGMARAISGTTDAHEKWKPDPITPEWSRGGRSRSPTPPSAPPEIATLPQSMGDGAGATTKMTTAMCVKPFKGRIQQSTQCDNTTNHEPLLRKVDGEDDLVDCRERWTG